MCVYNIISMYTRPAVINLRAKITYGPQMLRSVFLRFPLFIRATHTPPPSAATTHRTRTRGVPGRESNGARERKKTQARGYAHRHDAGQWLAPPHACRENRQYFCRAKNGPGGGSGSKTMRTRACPSALPPRVRLRQLHRPGPARTEFPLARRKRPSHTSPPAHRTALLMFLGASRIY